MSGRTFPIGGAFGLECPYAAKNHGASILIRRLYRCWNNLALRLYADRRIHNFGETPMNTKKRLSATASILAAIFTLFGVHSNAFAGATPVNIVNNNSAPIYVSFTLLNHTAGPIKWNSSGSGCSKTGATPAAAFTLIEPGTTCSATVDSAAGSSRFCAKTGNTAPDDCMNAQTEHLTMVESNFESASNPGCFGKGDCVWYDISVIPSTCTDALWKSNQCANTGGAAYNLPVTLSCSGMPTYTCQGPQNKTYGSENYPSNCGNPNGKCAVGTFPNGAACVNGVSAYFYPMFVPPENAYQPNAVCLSGTLTVTFLSGP